MIKTIVVWTGLVFNALNIVSIVIAYIAAPEAAKPTILKVGVLFVAAVCGATYLLLSFWLLRPKTPNSESGKDKAAESPIVSIRNDLQTFLDGLGEPPPLNTRTSDAAWKVESDNFTAYENRLTHGFQRRFHSRIREAIHTLGERNIGDADLEFEMGKGNVDYETLKKILDRLSALVSRVGKTATKN